MDVMWVEVETRDKGGWPQRWYIERGEISCGDANIPINQFSLKWENSLGERDEGVKNNCMSLFCTILYEIPIFMSSSHIHMTLHFQNLRNHDGHSSLLLLCRCLWYRHGRWRTSSSMTLLCYHDRRFTTTFVVGSQDTSKIVHPQMTSKYSSPPMCVVSPINDCYWRCHHSIPTYIV